ncbi:MAG: amidohydrolase family protein [Candidatus Competibacteraceae bacterium]|jgi:predicted TIM-barrel fold metal-dependent hydrolase|nr:amidohydrolase family protein [Candidatus Competibacteraceae bacterium]
MKLFDSHLHIIDQRFPLVPNNGYLPDEFTCQHYRTRTEPLNIIGGAVVSGSIQAFDQSYLRAALVELGPTFIGVTQLPASTSDQKIRELAQLGIRGLRFNLKRGGSESVEQLDYFARRVHELAGWHVELYIDSRDLPDLFDVMRKLPAVCIDHLGLSKQGLNTLLRLVEHGVYVKSTGFGRIDFAPEQAIRAIVSINPNALLFGTDLPSTRALRPFQDQDITLIRDTLSSAIAEKVLYHNAMTFYRVPDNR